MTSQRVELSRHLSIPALGLRSEDFTTKAMKASQSVSGCPCELPNVPLSSSSSEATDALPNIPVSPSEVTDVLPNVLESSSPSAVTDDGRSGVSPSESTSDNTVELVLTSSSSSMVCRICQLTEKEAGSPLHRTGCACRGTMDRCHRPCLEEWVRRRVSLQCELCHEPFTCIPPQVAMPVSDLRRSADLAHIAGDAGMPQDMAPECNMCGDSRRTWFGVVIFMLLFTTISAASLLAYIREEWVTADDSEERKYDVCYSLVLAVLVFCCTLFVAVLVLWLAAELFFWPRAQRRVSQWRMLHRPSVMDIRTSSVDNHVTRVARVESANAALNDNRDTTDSATEL